MTGARTPSSSPTPAATPPGGRPSAVERAERDFLGALSAADAAQFKKTLRALLGDA